MTHRLLLLTTVFALGLGLGCDKDDDLTNAEACANIIEACHSKDDGSDPMINGCHETAHNDGDCKADYDACIAACDEAPVITGGGSTGHDHDHGSSGG